MSDDERKKYFKNILKIEMEDLKREHLKNREIFESRKHKLLPFQFILESILLKTEEESYFMQSASTYNILDTRDSLFKSKTFVCERQECKREYTTQNGLKYHRARCFLKRINLNKPFSCDNLGCIKKYRTPGGLKYHKEHFHDKKSRM